MLMNTIELKGVKAKSCGTRSNDGNWISKRFGGDVKKNSLAFAGLGATGGGNRGNSTPIQIGIRGTDSASEGMLHQGENLKQEWQMKIYKWHIYTRCCTPYVEWYDSKESDRTSWAGR